MGWFDNIKSPKMKNTKKSSGSNTPQGLWTKCKNCGEILQSTKVDENLNVCPYCNHHFRLSAKERIDVICDKGSFKQVSHDLCSNDPLKFNDKKPYSDRLVEYAAKSQLKDSVVVGTAKIHGKEVAIAAMDFSFMGGSMGVVAGEKIAQCMELGLKHKCPVIVVSCSGGARMQEGILSLMQMGKTSAVRQRLRKNSIPYISLLTDPTTGGCAASFSMLGDINIAEPGALIGFAGPRVIEQSIRQSLPEGFQRAEFLVEHGFVDTIVHRKDLKETLSFYVNMFS